MFMNLYDLGVIDEESFVKWKEEVNDIHPGKGQALFQVWYSPSIINLFPGKILTQKEKLLCFMQSAE